MAEVHVIAFVRLFRCSPNYRSAIPLAILLALSCAPGNLENPNDPASHSFLQIQVINCILKDPSCLSGSALSVSYTGSPYTFGKNLTISAITPTVTGTLSSCASSPALPAGLVIDNQTCAISGTPTVIQSATNYTIRASNSIGSTTATISISISATFAIGGTVTGLLTGDSIVISNNGSDDKTVNANGAFTFAVAILSGTGYSVTVFTQPTNTRCIVQNGPGTATANVTNVIVTCPVAIKNGKTWMRCTQGQIWNAVLGDCSGGAATTVQYCTTNDNACNDANPAGEDATVSGHLNGAGTSGAWSACQSLNTANAGAGTYGVATWRVPRKSEIMGLVYCSDGTPTPLANGTPCGFGSTSPTIDTAMFPNTVANYYWSASASSVSGIVYARIVYFVDGLEGMNLKANSYYVRCVSP